jgi:hypothetical protein
MTTVGKWFDTTGNRYRDCSCEFQIRTTSVPPTRIFIFAFL